MKKIVMFVGLFLGLSIGTVEASVCETVRFLNGESFCFGIEKLSTNQYQTKVTQSTLTSPLSCTLTLPNLNEVLLPGCQGTFSYAGRDRTLILDAEIENYLTTVSVDYNFLDYEFGEIKENILAALQMVGTIPTIPQLSEWISMTFKVYNEQNNVFTNFDGKIDLSVEEYRNGLWQKAYNTDYSLSPTFIQFAIVDRGSKTLNSFLRFTTEGTYRLTATSTYKGITVSGSQIFEINKNSNNSNQSYDQASSFEIYNISPSYPVENQWIDLSLRVYDRYGYLVRDYDGFLNVEVEKRVNGSWRSAPSGDFRLDAQTFRFYSSDRGDTTFKSMIRFSQAGEYRIKIEDRYDSSLYDTIKLTVDTRSGTTTNNSSYSEFSNKELKKIRAIYELWPQVIVLLKKDYSRLRTNSTWQNMSDDFYQNMRDAIYSDRGKFRYFDDFYQGFMEWFAYTSRVR